MKQIISKTPLLAIAGITIIAMFSLQSCSKSSNSTPAVTLLGGYASSDSVAASNLVAYWPFDADANDHKGGSTATVVGATFTTAGVRGNSYQGAKGAYATLTPSAAFSALPSYSLSVWYKLPSQQPSGDPGGLFFLSGTNTLNELIYEIESYAPLSKDSVKVHHGFTNLASAGWQGFTMETYDTSAIGKWVHLVTTYNAGSSTYVIYENGVPVNNSSAWGIQLSTILYQGNSGTAGTTGQGSLSWSTDPPKTITIGTWPATLYGVSATLGSNGCFLGQLDELRIFNRALTQAEVAGLYLNGQAGR